MRLWTEELTDSCHGRLDLRRNSNTEKDTPINCINADYPLSDHLKDRVTFVSNSHIFNLIIAPLRSANAGASTPHAFAL